MAEAESDVQRCDTPQSPEEAGMDEMSDGQVEGNINSSSTFDFAERSWRTDFTLVVEGTRFYVAKNILALASPVFDRMFESDFKESTTDELELPGKKADDVNEFLRAIYPNTASVLSKESVLKVLPLAEEYQVINLKRRCEDAFLGSIDALTAIEELYRLIKEAHLYGLKELLKRCISFVCDKSVEQIERANRDIVLPGEPLSDILKNINDKLVTRIKELESSLSYKTQQLEMYMTWRNYFSNALEKSAFPKLDEDLVWAGRTWMFTMNVKKRKPVEDNVTLWNTEMKIKFDIVVFFGGPRIHANIENNTKGGIECSFEIQFAVVNKVPTENHFSQTTKANFRSNEQSIDFTLMPLAEIEDPKKGFVDEGKIQLEVNMFMSEPKNLYEVKCI